LLACLLACKKKKKVFGQKAKLAGRHTSSGPAHSTKTCRFWGPQTELCCWCNPLLIPAGPLLFLFCLFVCGRSGFALQGSLRRFSWPHATYLPATAASGAPYQNHRCALEVLPVQVSPSKTGLIFKPIKTCEGATARPSAAPQLPASDTQLCQWHWVPAGCSESSWSYLELLPGANKLPNT
jgi:hypothetical protein